MKQFRYCLTICLLSLFIISSCKKDTAETLAPQGTESQSAQANKENGHLKQTKTFSADVAQQWQALLLGILRQPAGPNIYGMSGNRNFAYSSIAMYEAVVPGMPAYQSLAGQLTDMPQMPKTEPGKAYHWPASANAALAAMTKSLYPNANVAAMETLENSLHTEYQQQVPAAVLQRSVAFGKEVARLIFEWSKLDGALNTYPPFQPATELGKWSPTAPNPTAVFAPNWGKNRLFVPGSLDNTNSAPPPPYSTNPNSAYYAMVKEVYDISKTLTPAQIATALYFRDNPGFQAGTHYIYIFNKVMQKEKPSLDVYAVAAAKTSIAIAEAQIGCWKLKYSLLVERPWRYIRDVIGDKAWKPLLNMPPHPDFPSGHSQTGGAFAAVLTSLYGSEYQITLDTYDNLGMAQRTYPSFNEMVADIGRSRVYGSIHYSYSCEEGNKQGVRIANNILNTLNFKK